MASYTASDLNVVFCVDGSSCIAARPPRCTFSGEPIAPAVCVGGHSYYDRRVQRLEVNDVLAEQVFIIVEAIQQLLFREPATMWTC